MSKSTASKEKMHSEHALLCLLGQKAQELKLLDPLQQLVKIDQKTLVHSPTEKLVEALLAIACGAEAPSQITTVLRPDPYSGYQRPPSSNSDGVGRCGNGLSSSKLSFLKNRLKVGL